MALVATVVAASLAAVGGVPFLVGSLILLVICLRLHTPWLFIWRLAIATLVTAVPLSALSPVGGAADRLTLLFLLLMSLVVAGAIREARLDDELADDGSP